MMVENEVCDKMSHHDTSSEDFTNETLWDRDKVRTWAIQICLHEGLDLNAHDTLDVGRVNIKRYGCV